MNKLFTVICVLAIGVSCLPATVFARGFGGFRASGFSGGGFDRGSYGGNFDRGSYGGSFDRGSYGGGSFDRGSYGSVDRSSYGGFDRSNYGGGSVDRSGDYGGYRAGGFSAGGYGAGGFRAGDYNASVNRGQLNSFLDLPTDGGFHAAGGAYGARGIAAGPEGAAAYRGGATGHVYQGPDGTTIAHGAVGVQGAAIGPGGAAAGGRFASGTAIKTPDGNVYTHDTTAGRGIAAGPYGTTAGRYAATGTAVNGAAVAGRSYAAYGTRAWSPTWCHAQAVACNGWCAGRGMYTGAWCAAHPWAWYPAAYTAADWAAAVWAPVAWGTLGPWFDCTTPYGYNYGNDIVYQDDNVYYGGQLAGTTQQYYQEANTLADSTASAQASEDQQWLPLGVFGLTEEGKKTPSMIFQLAVDKDGVIRGNYFDQVTQTNKAVTGAVDKKTQRVAWRVTGGKGLVVDTGLYNLTMNESTALVHYGPDRTEQELLVRMKQPDAGQTTSN